jgi:hypothetical protein
MENVRWEILTAQSILWNLSDMEGLKGPFLSVLAVHLWRLALLGHQNNPSKTY